MYKSIQAVAQDIKKGKAFPWLAGASNKIEGIIISPDTDGFISGLLLNEFFKWKVVGFYDGKIFVTTEGSDFKNKKEKYIFIDMEILRPNIKSIGHHILLYDAENPHLLINGIKNSCIQPNNWRGKSFNKSEIFATKYPFGTFHLLISILYYLDSKNSAFAFDEHKAIAPSIYIDGVFKNLFNYPENCLDWLKYMTNDETSHPFERLLNNPTTPKDLMILMENFFALLNKVWTTKTKRMKGKLKLDNDLDGSTKCLYERVGQDLSTYLD